MITGATTIACPLCEACQARFAIALNGYQVFRCAAYGFQFVHPTPTPAELGQYYDQSYAVPLERYAHNSARNIGHIADLERWQPGRGGTSRHAPHRFG